MKDSPVLTAVSEQSAVGLGDALSDWQQRYGAIAICGALALSALLAVIFGLHQGPEIKPLLPITSSISSFADLLTAFLLIAQYYVNGRFSFAVLSAAYAVSGVLTWLYLLTFPGLFATHPLTGGDQDIFVYFWMLWHCSFPLLVMLAVLFDSPFHRIVSRGVILLRTILAATVPLLVASLLAALLFLNREALPQLVLHGHLLPLDRIVFQPAILALNAIATLVVLMRHKRTTSLQLWLCVTMFATCLDSLLVNLSASTYSYAWDVGKIITVVSACTVLVMILADIASLYSRLAKVARIDPLTLLPNRRALQEHWLLVIHNAQRTKTSVAMLVIDIDNFKQYNDAYGHGAGDECLRAVAHELAVRVSRPLDLTARCGGEEFIAILPDTSLQGATFVAERIRTIIEALPLPLAQGDITHVTVSIGVGYAAPGTAISAAEIFDAADRGLYEAKDHGRNRVAVGGASDDQLREPATRTTRSISVVADLDQLRAPAAALQDS